MEFIAQLPENGLLKIRTYDESEKYEDNMYAYIYIKDGSSNKSVVTNLSEEVFNALAQAFKKR